MAWNEPGGGKGPQDPWKSGSDQGPPDLDEMIKKLHRKLTGKGGGGPNTGEPIPKGFIVGAVVAAIIVTLLTGFYRVEEAEEAVVLRFGEYKETKQAGLQWNIPMIDQVLKANTKLISSHSHKAHMLTSDENIVDVRMEVQYFIEDPKQFFLDIADPKDSLAQATESALRHVVGGEKMDSVMTKERVEVARLVKERIQKSLDTYKSGIEIVEVNIQDAQPPGDVKSAFDDVIKAKEDRARYIDEAKAYREQKIPRASGQREKILAEANAYKQEVIDKSEGEVERFNKLLVEYQIAPEVTRSRLYLEAMETVLSNTSKVMVDLEGGNNLVYLPLDKMIGQNASGQTSSLSDLESLRNNNTFTSSQQAPGVKSSRSTLRRAPIRESR